MKPFVSVVIPTYNRPDLVRTAIGSVLAQTHADFELIVIDDHSSQPVAESISDIHDPRLRIIRHEINQGLSASRNTGIGVARGVWIAFLDDDDVWLPEKLNHQIAFINQHVPDADFSVTDCYEPLTGRHLNYARAIRQKGIDYTLLHWNGLLPSTWMVKRSVFDRIGNFDTAFPRTEDWEWLLRLYMAKAKIAAVPEVLTHYAGSHNSNPALEIACMKKVADKYRAGLRAVTKPISFCFFEIALNRRFAKDAHDRHDRQARRKYGLRVAKHLGHAAWIAPLTTIKYVVEVVAKKALQVLAAV